MAFLFTLMTLQNACIYQGRNGIIWLETPGYGVSYFNPAKNFFYTVYPFLETGVSMTGTWAMESCKKYKDESSLYEGYNDLNEWMQQIGKSQKKGLRQSLK